MADEIKRMCKWDKKKVKKDPSGFAAAVLDPKYLCSKCVHVANSKKLLCDPVALKQK